MRRVITSFLVLGCLLAFLLQLRRGSDRLESNHLVWTVRQRGQAVIAGQAPARVLPPAVSMIRRARELDPGSIEAIAAAGDLFMLLGREETALRTYREALAHEPRPEIYLNLGNLELRMGNREEARRLFGIAQRLDRRLRRNVRQALEGVGPEPNPKGPETPSN